MKNQFEMPLDMIRENVDTKLKVLMEGIKKATVHNEDGDMTHLQNELQEKITETSKFETKIRYTQEAASGI